MSSVPSPTSPRQKNETRDPGEEETPPSLPGQTILTDQVARHTLPSLAVQTPPALPISIRSPQDAPRVLPEVGSSLLAPSVEERISRLFLGPREAHSLLKEALAISQEADPGEKSLLFQKCARRVPLQFDMDFYAYFELAAACPSEMIPYLDMDSFLRRLPLCLGRSKIERQKWIFHLLCQFCLNGRVERLEDLIRQRIKLTQEETMTPAVGLARFLACLYREMHQGQLPDVKLSDLWAHVFEDLTSNFDCDLSVMIRPFLDANLKLEPIAGALLKLLRKAPNLAFLETYGRIRRHQQIVLDAEKAPYFSPDSPFWELIEKLDLAAMETEQVKNVISGIFHLNAAEFVTMNSHQYAPLAEGEAACLLRWIPFLCKNEFLKELYAILFGMVGAPDFARIWPRLEPYLLSIHWMNEHQEDRVRKSKLENRFRMFLYLLTSIHPAISLQKDQVFTFFRNQRADLLTTRDLYLFMRHLSQTEFMAIFSKVFTPRTIEDGLLRKIALGWSLMSNVHPHVSDKKTASTALLNEGIQKQYLTREKVWNELGQLSFIADLITSQFTRGDGVIKTRDKLFYGVQCKHSLRTIELLLPHASPEQVAKMKPQFVTLCHGSIVWGLSADLLVLFASLAKGHMLPEKLPLEAVIVALPEAPYHQSPMQILQALSTLHREGHLPRLSPVASAKVHDLLRNPQSDDRNFLIQLCNDLGIQKDPA